MASPGGSSKTRRKKKDASVFQNFKLSGLDADTAKYLPFESLSFPRMPEGGPEAEDRPADGGAGNLKSMWMVGVLDYDEEQLRREREAATDVSKRVQVGSKVRANVVQHKKVKLKKTERNFRKMQRTYLQRSKKKKTRKEGSRTMLKLFEAEREQHNASVMLQRVFRRRQRMRYWQDMFVKEKKIKVLQAVTRGFVARVLIKRWWNRKVFLVRIIQSLLRGFLTRKRTIFVRQVLQGTATVIQTCYRARLGRRRGALQRREVNARTIQRCWRGMLARRTFDTAWLAQKIAVVQAMVRGLIWKQRVVEYREEMWEASNVVQRAFLGFLGRRAGADRLFERENEERALMQAVYRSDASYKLKEQRQIRSRVKDLKMQERLEKLNKERSEAYESIDVAEEEFGMFQREIDRLSPKAIVQGWDNSVRDQQWEWRRRVTAMKLEVLFGAGAERQALRERYDTLCAARDQAEWEAIQATEDRTEELKETWARNDEEKWRGHAHDKAILVANQRRKWGVRWHTLTGKPDRTRRRGYPWDPSILVKDGEHVPNGNLVETVDHTAVADGNLAERIKAQAATNTFLQYGTLLKPLFSGMDHMKKRLEEREQSTAAFTEWQHRDMRVKKGLNPDGTAPRGADGAEGDGSRRGSGAAAHDAGAAADDLWASDDEEADARALEEAAGVSGANRIVGSSAPDERRFKRDPGVWASLDALEREKDAARSPERR